MKVYRCYDNRLRYTQRRPDLYETCPGLNENCQVVLHIPDTDDPSCLLAFGNVLPTATPAPAPTKGDEKILSNMEWLWKFQGQLKVISTPYHEGKHYATKPKHFLPIIDHLEQIHASGFVHGDIRAYNMVLNYKDDDDDTNDPNHKPEGYLIDFDFGGREAESPTYPSGYVHKLDDAFRLGRPGDIITTAHDWYALGDVIMNRHELRFTRKMPTVREELDDLRNSFIDTKGDFSSFPKMPGDNLRDYIRIATNNDCHFVLENGFNDSLEANEFLEGTKGATGSPPNHDAKRQ